MSSKQQCTYIFKRDGKNVKAGERCSVKCVERNGVHLCSKHAPKKKIHGKVDIYPQTTVHNCKTSRTTHHNQRNYYFDLPEEIQTMIMNHVAVAYASRMKNVNDAMKLIKHTYYKHKDRVGYQETIDNCEIHEIWYDHDHSNGTCVPQVVQSKKFHYKPVTGVTYQCKHLYGLDNLIVPILKTTHCGVKGWDCYTDHTSHWYGSKNLLLRNPRYLKKEILLEMCHENGITSGINSNTRKQLVRKLMRVE